MPEASSNDCAPRAARNSPSLLFDPLGRHVAAHLVQHKLLGRARPFHFETDLRVHNFQEVFLLALREQFKFRLPRGLRKQVIAFACNRQNEIGRQLIAAGVFVEQLRIHRDLFALFRRTERGGIEQRRLRTQQVDADVVDSRRS